MGIDRRLARRPAPEEERPISVVDYVATLCAILGIDDSKENTTPDGRPIRIVDKGATPVTELL